MSLPDGGRAVVLDRDGTLVDVVRDEETGFVGVAWHPRQLVLMDGVVEGLAALRDAGFLLAIATNQPAPAKGQFSRDAVLRTNQALVELLAGHGIQIGTVQVCMHHPKGGPGGDASLVGDCACRKPKPGLVIDALAALGADPARSWMVGDSPGDVTAGRAAGVRTGLVFDTKRCELCPLRSGPEGRPDVHAPTFAKVAARILEESR